MNRVKDERLTLCLKSEKKEKEKKIILSDLLIRFSVIVSAPGLKSVRTMLQPIDLLFSVNGLSYLLSLKRYRSAWTDILPVMAFWEILLLRFLGFYVLFAWSFYFLAGKFIPNA